MPSAEDTSGLEFLLLSPCFMPGKKIFRENKTFVSVHPEQDEAVLFFCTDDQTDNPHCKDGRFRQFLWGKQEGYNLCDLIVFYAQGTDKRVICFTELKDNIKDVDHAVTQIITTYNSLKKCIKLRYTAKAFIFACSGSLPQEHQKYQQKLNQTFGSGNYEWNGKGDRFTEFLRGESKTGQGKRKQNKR